MSKLLSETQRKRIRIAQNFRCCYCLDVMTPPVDVTKSTYPPLATTETIEHLRPRAQGGKHNIDNLVLACKSCNNLRGKTNMNWLQFCTIQRSETESGRQRLIP